MIRFDPISYFDLDKSWKRIRVITTTDEEYSVQRQEIRGQMSSPVRAQVPKLSQKALQTLDAIYNVVDLTHTIAKYGKMAIVPLFATLFFVNLSTSMLLIVVWWANSFAIAFLGLMYHDLSHLEEGTYQLKRCFTLIYGPDEGLREYERPSMDERDGRLRLEKTLIQVQNAIFQIERTQNSIKALHYFSYPLRTPLANVKANLENIETHIVRELTPK